MKKYKQVFLFLVFSLAVVIFMYFVFAAKPIDVISWSNGFPSGEHFNLNIHGKNPSFVCDPTPGGNSVFVPEYGTSEIQLIENRKSSITELNAIDPCGMTDPAKVLLPYGEYQVYARILAKPGKKQTGEERGVILYPKLIDACNDNATAPIEGFGEYINCSNSSLIGLGVVTSGGAWDLDSQGFLRTVPVKGNNKAVDVTELFMWTGYACDEIYDTNGDGEITVADVTSDLNGDLVIDDLDLQIYLSTNCVYYDSEWIFNIADLVVYGWDYKNNGAKLLQVRFYPESTTYS